MRLRFERLRLSQLDLGRANGTDNELGRGEFGGTETPSR